MDFSFSEIALIIIVAFLVFGPEKLPDVAHKIGRIIAKTKKIGQSLTDEIKSSISSKDSHEK